MKSNINRLVKDLEAQSNYTQKALYRAFKKYPKTKNGQTYTKSEVLAAYRQAGGGKHSLVEALTTKPVRTLSGVMPVTVLTKPFPCPGKCIFCPNDIRMPKSYISSEPGAQRAEKNHFDPYLQTYNRLVAYQQMGHPVDKAEVIVLGGTWSFYPEKYQIWFIKRIFEALNDFGESIDQRGGIPASINVGSVKKPLTRDDQKIHYNSTITMLYKNQESAKKHHAEEATWTELENEHLRNQKATVRCVGLVLETRPDYISKEEVIKLRRLGATKTQIGLQSLQDEVLAKNNRGHTVAASRKALKLLRQAGFKIHAHWMPNLYGSTVVKDKHDFHKLFHDLDFKPDELKIYPCSLIPNTELVEKYQKGLWQPYTKEQLLSLLTYTLKKTPRYCRLTRIIRDIPGQEIMVGNKITNFRQLAEKEAGSKVVEIRAREIKKQSLNKNKLRLKDTVYHTSVSTEHFLEILAPKDTLAAFLRLSLPKRESYISELKKAAIIREVHVYGQSVKVGEGGNHAAQHLGLGKKLIHQAQDIARESKYVKISVISAVGTREYYRKLGFENGKLYQHLQLL